MIFYFIVVSRNRFSSAACLIDGVPVTNAFNQNGWLKGERRFGPEDGWEITVYREWYRATFDPEDPPIIPLPDSLHTGDGAISRTKNGK